MIHLSTIHEKMLTSFHRNHFILTVSDLENTSIFKDHDLTNDNHLSLETCQRVFPSASKRTVANLLLTTMQIKVEQGQNHFLFAFNDQNKEESLDVVNGLVQILGLTPSSDEQQAYFDYLKTCAFEWTHLLIAEEENMKRLGTQPKH